MRLRTTPLHSRLSERCMKVNKITWNFVGVDDRGSRYTRIMSYYRSLSRRISAVSIISLEYSRDKVRIVGHAESPNDVSGNRA